VVTLFNVDKVAKTVLLPELQGRKLKVHKVQLKSSADQLARTAQYDAATGAFTIPPRTTVVFVENAVHGD
jgi:pullulanase